MISLNDIFNEEIGNEYVFTDQSVSSTIAEQSSYIPGLDLVPLTPIPVPSHAYKPCDDVSALRQLSMDSEDRTDEEEQNVDQLMDCLDKCGVKLDEIRKQNHSEIEKRRREKMNMLIRELARLVPMCSAIPANRKLDKLTVLRMTVQHIKAIRKRAAIADAMTPTPSFVSDDCVDKMLLQVTEGFLFVVSCDRGKILYVSDSVKQTLNYNQRDLLGMSWFDVLHHKDIPKVKEQLSLWESFNGVKEKHIDDKMSDTDNMEGQAANNVSPTIESCPGSRRSFFCRMKYKFHINRNDGKGIRGLANKKRQRINIMNDKYCDLYCMGYLKSWTTQEGQPPSPTCAATSQSTCDESGAKVCQSSVSSHTGCLVAMARVMPQTDRQHHVSDKIFPVKPIEYTSRHSMDGMYLFVDQRVTPLLGYLPQELLGTSCYDYCHPDDVLTLAESHRTALHQQNVSKNSLPYRFRTKLGTYLYLTTLWKTFKNPWTREFEYMIAISENVATPDDKTSLCSTTAPKEETTNLSHRKSEAKNGNLEVKTTVKHKHKCHSKWSSQSSTTEDGLITTSTHSSIKSMLSSNQSLSPLSATSIVKKFFTNRIKHSKIGQQIAEEVLEAQRRADEFSTSSSCSSQSSSNSPPSSLDTSNTSAVGSLNGNSSAISGKSMSSDHESCQPSLTSITVTNTSSYDSGVDNQAYDSLSLPSIPSMSNSSLADISQLEPIPAHNIRFLNSNHSSSTSGDNNGSSCLSNDSMNGVNNPRVHYNSAINELVGNVSQPQNHMNEETDEAAISLIMSILEADVGMGGQTEFSEIQWPLY